MLLLERYVTEMEQDLKVDAFNIKEVQLRLPAIKHKWTARLIRHKIEINTLTKDKEKKRKEKKELLDRLAEEYEKEVAIAKAAAESGDGCLMCGS